MNITAIAVAALVPMALGFIWYHPKVFGTVWMHESGMTEEKAKRLNMFVKLGLSFLFSLMVARGLNTMVVHDSFVKGATYYKTNHTMKPEPGTELAQWLDYYNNNLAADNHTFKHGMFHAFFLIGVLMIIPFFATHAIYEAKSWKYFLITAGYWIISVTLMGGIIAAWR